MTPSPIYRRLIDLRLLGTPEQAEELAFLEEYADLKLLGEVSFRCWRHKASCGLLIK